MCLYAISFDGYSGTTYDIYTQADKILAFGGNIAAENCYPTITYMFGICGDPEVNDGKDVTWTLTQNNQDNDNPTYTMTISGIGSMANYASGTQPWNDMKDTITKVVIENGVTRTGQRAFQASPNLRELTLKGDVTIGDRSFHEAALTSINGQNHIVKIEGRAFKWLNMDTIDISNATELYEYAFEASKLKTITLGNSLKAIKDQAFVNGEMTQLYVPDGTTLEGLALYGMSHCVAIRLPSDLTAIPDRALRGCAEGEMIYVDNAAVSSLLNEANYSSDRASIAVLNGGIVDFSHALIAGTFANVTKEGYTLDGWYTQDGAENNWGEKVTVPVAGQTYYAKWDINTYSVTWDVDGTSTTANYTYGAVITPPQNPTKAGYDFAGWSGYTSGMTIPADNVTFTAQWSKIYSGGSGSGSSSDTSTSTTKNPDGSTTTTTTDKTTGTVTETVKSPDGTTGTVVTDKDGAVTEVKASVSSTAAKEAEKTGGAVTLPVEVPSAKTTGDAPAVEVTMPRSTGSVKVEIPVEKVTPGTVAVIVQADGTEKIVSTSAVTENGVALSLSGSATVKVIDNSKSFTDVSATNVFYNEICSLSAREIMVGKTDEKFDLYSSVTLNQIANVAGRITGAVDVKDYNAGIAWGAENGLKTGNMDASRGDVLKALYVAAGSPTVADTGVLTRFNDASAIPADLTAAAAWAAQNGILKGDLNGNASLNANVTRGQACALAGRTMGTLA